MKLEHILKNSLYQGYSYAYPHKTAYRTFEKAHSIEQIWEIQRRSPMLCYVHLPFCEMRCGFCNLFTTTNPQASMVEDYLEALQRQMRQLAPSFANSQWAQLAFGGGTPTYLQAAELERLFTDLYTLLGIDPKQIAVGIETSPHTATAERLAVLQAWQVDRVSIGVQSFIEAETKAAGRAQRLGDVERALYALKEAGFPRLNIDLIYGIPGQTMTTWLWSLEQALAYEPEELFLYPLYIRPLTGLGKQQLELDHQRPQLYTLACERLQAAGYVQRSMRMFQRANLPEHAGPAYCCQNDGMLGLGVGARSYTQNLHYSSEYAVAGRAVRQIIHDFIEQSDYTTITYGIELDRAEQQRRFVIQSLLQWDGLEKSLYRERFSGDVLEDLPQLSELTIHGLMQESMERLQLTGQGIAASDAIGPWLYSSIMQARMEAYECR